MADLLISLQEFTASLPPFLRWVGVMLAAVIPYVEAEGGAILGIAAGMNPVLAIGAAIAGNAIALTVVVTAAAAVRSGVTAHRERGAGDVVVLEEDTPAPDAKRARMRRVFNRYGVPGVSLLGPLLLPSHVTAATMVGFGAPRRTVLIWGIIAVGLWATIFGTIAHLGVSALIG